jgi:hypothetical protein
MLHGQGVQSNIGDENSALTIIRSKTPAGTLAQLLLQGGLGSGLPDRHHPSQPSQTISPVAIHMQSGT